jgi:hypothetical protein
MIVTSMNVDQHPHLNHKLPPTPSFSSFRFFFLTMKYSMRILACRCMQNGGFFQNYYKTQHALDVLNDMYRRQRKKGLKNTGHDQIGYRS